MRRLIALTTMLAAAYATHAIEDADARLIASREVASSMQTALKGELLQAITRGGPLAAIEVCQTRAPVIAEHVGNEAGVRVWRTALKLRNPANSPDEGARAVLEDFSRRLAAGEGAEKLEHFERAADGSARYMKAIVTQPPCETCHGPAIAEPVRKALAERYPADQATGFVAGELRGAVVVDWPGMSGAD